MTVVGAVAGPVRAVLVVVRGQSGLVYKAVKGQFHQLPSQPVVIVTDGQTGTTPPVKTSFADGTLTVYVATTYDAVNPAQTRDIDKLQFNLMFTS